MKILYKPILLFLSLILSLIAEEAVRVEPSELIQLSQRYDGKRIIVEGDVASGPEMTVMYLGRTPESSDPNGMLILFPEAVSKRPSKVEKRFNAILKKQGRVHAVLEGYFNSSADRRWGHQLCCRFKLEIEKVVSIQ